MERVLTLYSGGLLSKWGFNDGDEPDDVADWLEADGIAYRAIPWHAVLCRLVREHLVPVLDQAVEVYDIESNHNPIRAETVDGVEVNEYLSRAEQPLSLTPEHVDVPYSTILRVTREEMDRASTAE